MRKKRGGRAGGEWEEIGGGGGLGRGGGEGGAPAF